MKYLITGGFGFLGSAIAKSLIQKGNEVRILDNHFKPVIDKNFIQVINNKYKINLDDNIYHTDEFLYGDARNIEVCFNACKGIDKVIHCAAIHMAEDLNKDLKTVIDVNIRGTLNLLKASVQSNVSKFVYISTAKVYGEPEHLPSKENDFVFPMETYALTKSIGEGYMNKFYEMFGLSTISIRPFSVYGPRQNIDAGYIGMIIKALLGVKIPPIPADPFFHRDFTFISDLVDIVISAAENKEIKNEVFNAGSGMTETLKEIITMAEDIALKKIYLNFIQPKLTTIAKTHADMSKVHNMLGVRPKIHIKEGLKLTLNWFLNMNGKSL